MHVDELLDELGTLEDEIRSAADTILGSPEASDLVSILCNLGDYVVLQSSRLRRYGRDDIDLVAFSARGIMEATLLLLYFTCEHTASLPLLLQHVACDFNDIVKGIRALEETDSDVSGNTQALEEICVDDTAPKRSPRFAELATRFELKAEYQAFYKLFSKYVHPSAYFLFGERDDTTIADLHHTFVKRGVGYMRMFAHHLFRLIDVLSEDE